MIEKKESSKVAALSTATDCSVVGNNILNALSDVVDVLGGDATDGDSTVLSHVNAVFLHHSLALFHGQASEGEHANLGRDVRPVTLDGLLLNGSAESFPHIVHASADDDELV